MGGKEGEGSCVEKVGAPVSGGGGLEGHGLRTLAPGSRCWRVTGAEGRPRRPRSRSLRGLIPGPQLPSPRRKRKVGVAYGAGGAPSDLRVGSRSERRGGRPTAGRGRVGSGRAEGVSGRARPPGGSRRPVPGGGRGRAGPCCGAAAKGTEGGPWRPRPAVCPRAEFAASPSPGYLWAVEKVASPLRRPPEPRRAPTARRWTAA